MQGAAVSSPPTKRADWKPPLLGSGSLPTPLTALQKELRLGASEELFGKAAEKDRFARANPSCGGLPPCAPQTEPIPPSPEFGQR
jgi:hypothetical protein